MGEPFGWMARLRRHTAHGARLRFILLLGLCAGLVEASLYASHLERRLGDQVDRLHRSWSDRMVRYGHFGQHALAMSAPCNEVFDTGDLDGERARTQRAHDVFVAELDSARHELEKSSKGASSAGLLIDLKVIETATDDMLVDVDRTFTSYGIGAPPDVSVIDGHMTRINEAVGRLGLHALEAQALESRALLASALFQQYLISGFLLLSTALLAFTFLVLPAPKPSAAEPAPAPVPRVIAHAPESLPVAAPAEPALLPQPLVFATHSLEIAPDPMLALDEHGRITAWNTHAERVFGGASADLRGLGFTEALIASVDRERIDMALAGSTEPGGALQLERRFDVIGIDHRGEELPLEVAIVLSPGLDGGFVVTARDVTERRRVESALHDSQTRARAAEALRVGQNRVLELVARGWPLDDTLAQLIRMVEHHQEGIQCMVLILDPTRARPRAIASSRLPEAVKREVEGVEAGASTGSWGAAACTQQRIIAETTATHPHFAEFRRLVLEHGLRSSWAEPIVSASGHPLGAFTVFRGRIHTPDVPELELVTSAAHLAAIAIERSCSIQALGEYLLEEAMGRAGLAAA